jgi:hypothetical protein
MRRVFVQGHVLTMLKYLVLVFAYFAGLSFLLFVAAVFAAFSI